MEMEAAGHQKSESEDEQLEVFPVLPDDVVLQVFEHLALRELFTARIVCRRWADLALHPDVWRHRELPKTGYGQRSKKGKLRAALALAPRAKSLRLDEIYDNFSDVFGSTLSIFDDDGVLAELAVKTRCAIESLYISIDDCRVGTVARILENQAKLGRTRKLQLVMYRRFVEGAPGQKWKDLLASLCAMQTFTELQLEVETFDEDFDIAWMPALATTNKSSLKTLSCDFLNTTWAVFMGRLMEWHAPTLESVCLSGTCDEGSVGLPPGCWSDSLARTVRLRELDCPMLPNMAESLLQCTELESLCLRFEPDFRRHSAVWREARKYLWKAKGLQKLSISRWGTNFEEEYRLATEPASDLVEALTYSSQPTLEVLKCYVGSYNQGNLELVDRLSAVVLGHLPALRELHVSARDGLAMLRLLDRLSRVSRTLTLRVESETICPHRWRLQKAASIKACFDRNPGLHLGLVPFGSGMGCSGCKVLGSRKRDIIVYGHPDDVQCDHSQPNTDYILHSLPGEVAAQ